MSEKTVKKVILDESLILASIHEGTFDASKVVETTNDAPSVEKEPVNTPIKEQPKEPPKKKRSNTPYGETYLKPNEIKQRKCVYISLDIHNVISTIVKVIANSDLSVGGYIDNVLKQHLESNKDEINKLYRQDRTDLY